MLKYQTGTSVLPRHRQKDLFRRYGRQERLGRSAPTVGRGSEETRTKPEVDRHKVVERDVRVKEFSMKVQVLADDSQKVDVCKKK